MQAASLSLPAYQALELFRHDWVLLFLGSAFITVAFLAAIFALLGRKWDAMLIWLAVFAGLYGMRLWMRTDLVLLSLGDNPFFRHLRWATNYLVAIPAYLFFQATGYIGRTRYIRLDWPLIYIPIGIMLCLTAGTFLAGPHERFEQINSAVVVISLAVFCMRLFQRDRPDRSFLVLRTGLLIFIATSLFSNLLSLRHHMVGVLEPIGFALFLSALAYVAGRRNIERDAQLAAVQTELEVAQEIQRSILPVALPDSKSFGVAARYVPMRSVAGDFYDFLPTNDAELGLLIADVSGHGVPAALIASMVKMAAAAQGEHADDPASFLAGMNQVLCGNTQNQFVTAAYVHLNSATAEMRYAAAAHPPMLLLRDGQVSEVIENGLMLGAFPTATYGMVAHPLQPGDRLLLYTDGIVEAANAKREEFGHERLCELLREAATLSRDATVDRILETVRRWSATQEDDLTVLICDYARA